MAGKKEKPAPKYKLTLSIDHDFARRFDAYSAFIGEDMSDVAVRALKREMRGFSVSRKAVEDEQAEHAESATVRMARPGEQREAG